MQESTLFAVTFADPDAPVCVLSFCTRGQSPTLPSGAMWLDSASSGTWYRAPNEANVAAELAKALAGRVITSVRPITQADLPVRAYRNAWRDDGAKIAHDMPKARELHLERVRRARIPKLAELDTEVLRVLEQRQANPNALDDVLTRKQALRDLPATLNVEAANTVEELLALWPASLG